MALLHVESDKDKGWIPEPLSLCAVADLRFFCFIFNMNV